MMKRATAADADFGDNPSKVALAEARERRAHPDYVPGEALRRKLAEPVLLPQVDRNTILRWAGVPEKEWGMHWIECVRDSGEFHGPWMQRAGLAGHFCVVDGHRQAFDWFAGWQPSEGSLYISGPVGNGKSLLASCKAEELLTVPVRLEWRGAGYRRTGGVSVVYTDEISLARSQRAYRRHGIKGGKSPIQRAAECAVLVIDDFLSRPTPAKGYKQEDEDEDLEWMVNQRYAGRLPIIITSNLPMESVEKARGKRVASRLYEMCSGYNLTVDCVDWRKV